MLDFLKALGFTPSSAVVITVVVGAIWRIEVVASKIARKFDFLLIEHEILIREYCKRNNIDLNDLPTRLLGAMKGGNK